MLLDLSKLHGQRKHAQVHRQPAALGLDDPDYRVVSPVELSMDVAKVGAGCVPQPAVGLKPASNSLVAAAWS